jgi:hypothetical protein
MFGIHYVFYEEQAIIHITSFYVHGVVPSGNFFALKFQDTCQKHIQSVYVCPNYELACMHMSTFFSTAWFFFHGLFRSEHEEKIN